VKKILALLSLVLCVSAFAGYNKHQLIQERVLYEVGNTYAGISSVTAGAKTLLALPAKATVLSVSAYVETAVVGGTMVVGDATDPDGYLLEGFEGTIGFYPIKHATAATTKAGAYVIATEGSTAVELVGGKYYASATNLLLTLGDAVTAGKVWFIVNFMVH